MFYKYKNPQCYPTELLKVLSTDQTFLGLDLGKVSALVIDERVRMHRDLLYTDFACKTVRSRLGSWRISHGQ